MRLHHHLLCIATVVSAFALPGPGLRAQGAADGVIVGGPLRYRVIATQPRLNREVTGPVTRRVQGVPAEPVDSFTYDGVGSVPIEGRLVLEIDPTDETGLVQAWWTDEYGDWTYVQTRFLHPEHASGVRLGSSVHEVEPLINEGVTPNVYMHGDTLAGMPVLPTVFTFLSAWGPSDVTLDGIPFVNPYELPAPQWLGHLMVTEGVRRPDGTVRTRTGAIYDPSLAGQGAVEDGDLEVHLVFHDERFPMTANFPPIFSFFYHLVFEDVVIQVVEADQPVDLGGGRTPEPFPMRPTAAGRRELRR